MSSGDSPVRAHDGPVQVAASEVLLLLSGHWGQEGLMGLAERSWWGGGRTLYWGKCLSVPPLWISQLQCASGSPVTCPRLSPDVSRWVCVLVSRGSDLCLKMVTGICLIPWERIVFGSGHSAAEGVRRE